MGAPHKHRDAIIAWANGEPIEYQAISGVWHEIAFPHWDDETKYRIKPKVLKKEGWVNVYKELHDAQYQMSYTKEAADTKARSDRIACIRIEWEEEI